MQESRIEFAGICICAAGSGSVDPALCVGTLFGAASALLAIQKMVCGGSQLGAVWSVGNAVIPLLFYKRLGCGYRI